MDAETKNVLVSICEMLREQIIGHAELEGNFHSALKALNDRVPSFQQRFSEYAETDRLAKTRDVSLSTEQTLLTLGRLIQKLKD